MAKIGKQIAAPLVSFMKSLSGEEKSKLIIPEVNNVFGFYSPTGGTGVSTMIVNVAAILASSKKVAVLDLDVFHPSLFRFLMTEEDENTSLKFDIYDKFIAEGTPAPQFGHKTRVDNITLFTCLPEADIIRWCQIDYHGIKACIKELSRLYDYVLIDIKGNLVQEPVLAALEMSTRVYTFIRPCIGDLESVYKDSMLLNTYSFGAKTKNIIQSPVEDNPGNEKLVQEYDLNLVCNVPFVKKVRDHGYNYDIFVLADGGSDKYARSYIEVCKWLADRIANYEIEEVTYDVSE